MVCIYCSADTQVINSRHQKRANNVWRRRKCTGCGAVFTTTEAADLSQTIRVRRTMNGLENFSRDALFVSVHDSLRHRPTAAADASALTATIITRLLARQTATIDREYIVATATDVLEHFDMAACTHYQAYHPIAQT